MTLMNLVRRAATASAFLLGLLLSGLAGHTLAGSGDQDSVRRPKQTDTGETVPQRRWERLARLEDRAFSLCVAFSPDGKLLAAGVGKQGLKVWEVATGKEVKSLEGHTNQVKAVAFSPDGKVLASAGWDKEVRLWDAASGKLLKTLQGHQRGVNALAFAPDGKVLASGSSEGDIKSMAVVKLWDVTTGKQRLHFQARAYGVRSLTWTPDGKTILTGSPSGLALWDAATGKLVRVLWHGVGGVNAVALASSGKLGASAHTHGEVRLWDMASGKELAVLREHGKPVSSVAFSPNGHWLASCGEDRTWRLWDVADATKVREAFVVKGGGPEDLFSAVTFSPEGKTVATSGKSLSLWEIFPVPQKHPADRKQPPG